MSGFLKLIIKIMKNWYHYLSFKLFNSIFNYLEGYKHTHAQIHIGRYRNKYIVKSSSRDKEKEFELSRVTNV